MTALRDAIVKHYTTTTLSMHAIAADLTCDPQTVRSTLVARGIPIEARPRRELGRRVRSDTARNVGRNQEILRLYLADVRRTDIARQYGLRLKQINTILVGLGESPQRAHRNDPSIPPLRTTEQSATLKADIINRFLHTMEPLDSVARELGCNRSYISTVLKDVERPPHRVRPKPKPTPERPDRSGRDQQIAELYASGMRIAEIAQRCGIATRSVVPIARRMGCAPRIPRLPSDQVADRNRQIHDAFKAGAAKAEIAQQFGLKETYIRDILLKTKD
jgi:transposase-like protein